MSAFVYFSESTSGFPDLVLTRPNASAAICTLQYLNEGGANVVFRIQPTPYQEPEHLPYPDTLIRLRKNLPHVQSAKKQLEAFKKEFRGLFPQQYFLKQGLVGVREGVAQRLNETLRLFNRRPAHRANDFLPEGEEFGLIIDDMSVRNPGEVMVQIKPKWLAQSPNAPPNAKRCRTCALRAQRASKHIPTATDSQDNCSLALLSEQEVDRARAAQSITTDPRLQDYLVHDAQELLRTLRLYQQRFDHDGVLIAENEGTIADLCKAMTLRDCTLFLRRSGEDVEAKLADLDMKQPGKMERWKQVERSLIKEGWYEHKEENSVWSAEKICLLSRK